MVRVRFAPSPTGFLHVGGARTALYNFLFARQKNGRFILRIEDTDKNRSTEKAISQIKDSLTWLGLPWDEGPETGGDYGPYHQSQRLDLHKEAAISLLSGKKAYYCFCEPGELDARRKELQKAGKSPVYQQTCRNLSQEQINSYLAKGLKPALRLATPTTGETIVHDLVKGKVVFQNESIDDYIILRADKTPTYNLAVVFDDNHMQISHVIRGDDHLSNTPRQVVLYQALGYDLPKFAHLPLISGPDKKPLSKRHGSVAIEEFKKQGFLPQAMVNYLALLGWSLDDKTTFFSRPELIKEFSLEKVSKNPAMWDSKKLSWLNGEYIRKLSDKNLAEILREILNENSIEETDLARLEKISALIKERMRTMKEAFPLIEFFFRKTELDEGALKLLKETEGASMYLLKSEAALQSITDFKTENIEASLRKLADDLGIKPSLLFQLIRASVSGRKVSPPLFESLEILGKEESLKRIDTTQEIL